MSRYENLSSPCPRNGPEEAELFRMLAAILDAHGGLSDIHRLLCRARTMQEIRARFARWQAGRTGLPAAEETGKELAKQRSAVVSRR